MTEQETLKVMKTARAVIDELMPGIGFICCDIGLINDGCVELNKAMAKLEGKDNG